MDALTTVCFVFAQVRGCSYYFSASAMFAFLEQNRLLAVIRAHEYAELGYMFHFNSEEYEDKDKRADKSLPPLITVFSAANYCDQHGNLVSWFVSRLLPFAGSNYLEMLLPL